MYAVYCVIFSRGSSRPNFSSICLLCFRNWLYHCSICLLSYVKLSFFSKRIRLLNHLNAKFVLKQLAFYSRNQHWDHIPAGKQSHKICRNPAASPHICIFRGYYFNQLYSASNPSYSLVGNHSELIWHQIKSWDSRHKGGLNPWKARNRN